MVWAAMLMVLIAIYQVPPLVKQKQWAELAVCPDLDHGHCLRLAGPLPGAGPRPVEMIRALMQTIYSYLGLDIQV